MKIISLLVVCLMMTSDERFELSLERDSSTQATHQPLSATTAHTRSFADHVHENWNIQNNIYPLEIISSSCEVRKSLCGSYTREFQIIIRRQYGNWINNKIPRKILSSSAPHTYFLEEKNISPYFNSGWKFEKLYISIVLMREESKCESKSNQIKMMKQIQLIQMNKVENESDEFCLRFVRKNHKIDCLT